MTVSINSTLDLIADEDYLKAEKQLKQLIALSPDNNELYNLYAYCENCIEEICENEDCDIPVSSLKTPHDITDWERLHEEVQKSADAGQYKKACTLLGLLWDSPPLEPIHPYTLNGLQPRTLLLRERAICYFLQDDWEQAKSNYLHALNIELSVYPPNAYERVPFLIKKKDYKEALRLLKVGSFTAYFSNRADVLYQTYRLHLLLGDKTQAYNALDKALRYQKLDLDAHPYTSYAYNRYAGWLMEQGNLKEALRQNSKAIALWPQFYGYQLKRAEIYAQMGQKEKAITQLDLLAKGNWCRLESYLPAEKAKVYECLGDLKTAENYYQKQTLRPLTRYENLCDFYTRHGRHDDITKLRQQQRQEPHFQDRVNESELMNLI